MLILQAYVNVNRTTAIFSQESYVTGNLVNVQREALLLNVKIEELPTTRDVRGDPGPPGPAGQPAEPAARAWAAATRWSTRPSRGSTRTCA